MTIRIIPILAVAIMIGPSLANGWPACMKESEARAKFPKAHLIGSAPTIAGRSGWCPCIRDDRYSRQSPCFPHNPQRRRAFPRPSLATTSQQCSVSIRHVSSRSHSCPLVYFEDKRAVGEP